MAAAVQRDSRSDSAQGPRPRSTGLTRLRKSLGDPVAKLRLVRRRKMLERRRGTHHLVQSFGLNAFGLSSHFRYLEWDLPFQVRLEVLPKLGLRDLVQSARDPAPHHPKFDPVRLLAVELHARSKQREALIAAPLIERVAESRPEAIAQELEIDALVIRRATPL